MLTTCSQHTPVACNILGHFNNFHHFIIILSYLITMLLAKFQKAKFPNFGQDKTPHSANFFSISAVHFHVNCYKPSNGINHRSLSCLV
jgi:hypothetical protein